MARIGSAGLKRACEDRDCPSIGPTTTLVMAIACGVVAVDLYSNQPMLAIIEQSFPQQTTVAGMVPTATQIGFAVGLLLLVPLGDRVERRRLILVQIGLLAISVIAAALAPNAWSLIGAALAIGVTSTVAQQIVPFAAELAAPSRRGSTIGSVMSGLLCGMLLGRALAGALGAHYGWRSMFWIGLLLVLAVGALLAAVLPRTRPATSESYLTLLRSLMALWRDEPALRRATMIQGCLFGSFSAIWTVLALQLDRRYDLGAQIAGLFGILGAVGILFAPLADGSPIAEDLTRSSGSAPFSCSCRGSSLARGTWSPVSRLASRCWISASRGFGIESARDLRAAFRGAQSGQYRFHGWNVSRWRSRLGGREPLLGSCWVDCGLRLRDRPCLNRPRPACCSSARP